MLRVGESSLRAEARRLATSQRVERRELSLAFEESTASSAEVLVEGKAFYPPLLADISAATSSVHINQFGFKAGRIGDAFAEALAAKAAQGVPVRLVVDAQGTDPERRSRAFYEPLLAAGIEVCVTRAMKPRVHDGALGTGGTRRWNLEGLGHVDHRKVVVVDGRIGWIGGAGIEDHFEDGRFHDLFVRITGPVVSQLQLVFVASMRWLGGAIPVGAIDELFPRLESGTIPAIVLHNAPGRHRPITDAIAALIDGARETLDVVNPYVTDRTMIRKIEQAANRGARVRLFVPADANNWACATAQRFHHKRLLAAGVRILEHPAMLHAKAFVRDGEVLLAGTCNLEAWSLRRFFEIDVRLRSRDVAAQFEERFSRPAEGTSTPGRPVQGLKEQLRAAAFAAASPLF